MIRTLKFRLAGVVLFVFLALLLRLFQLGASPLRGDEAFAVRYWTQPPVAILNTQDGLAWYEPHPLGTFFVYWAWRALVGDSEIAMRLLSVLVSLLGVPATYALARRLFKDNLIGLVAAALWALNPYLLWHSQDARNYAIWASLSVLALWLLLHAADAPPGKPRRWWLRWAIYALAVTASLYIFFLEIFIVVIHGLYILVFRRHALATWLVAIAIVALLLVPWFGQISVLAESGYQGTAITVRSRDVSDVIWRFYNILAFGEGIPGLAGIPGESNSLPTVMLFLLYLYCLVQVNQSNPPVGVFLSLYFLVPLGLLIFVATRIAVFNPRYILAVVPAMILPWAYLIGRNIRGWLDMRTWREVGKLTGTQQAIVALIVVLVSGSFLAPTAIALVYHYSPQNRKAPDWYGLRDYLRAVTTTDDSVIMMALNPGSGATDPAFAYYYPGPARVLPLPLPGVDTEQAVRTTLESSRAVWFVISGEDTAPVTAALLVHGQLITDEGAGSSFIVRQFRAKPVKPSEIETPLNLSIGDALLRGYGLLRGSADRLTVLLFWEKEPRPGLTTFVHLTYGSQVLAQQDHPPEGLRDVYQLDLSAVPRGQYRVEIGLYDPVTEVREPIRHLASAGPVTSYTLAMIER